MSKKPARDKALDLEVMALLQNNGVFNHIQARCCADVARIVTDAEIIPRIPLPTDSANIEAQKIVFDYLERNGMSETLRCIACESPSKVNSDSADDLGALCAFFKRKDDSPVLLTKSQRTANRQSIRASQEVFDRLDTPQLDAKKRNRLEGLKPKGVDEFESEGLENVTINDSDGLACDTPLWGTLTRSMHRL